jgi:hypothetical protein
MAKNPKASILFAAKEKTARTVEAYKGLILSMSAEGGWIRISSREFKGPIDEIRGIAPGADVQALAEGIADGGFVIVAHEMDGSPHGTAFFAAKDPAARPRKVSEALVFPTIAEAYAFFSKCKTVYSGLKNQSGDFYDYGNYFEPRAALLAEDYLARRFPLPRKRLTKGERGAIYAKFGGRCAYCGRPIGEKEMQADHFIPYMNGKGGDDPSNLMPSCADCNLAKGNGGIEEFRANIEAAVKEGGGFVSSLSAIGRLAEAYATRTGAGGSISFFYETAGSESKAANDKIVQANELSRPSAGERKEPPAANEREGNK